MIISRFSIARRANQNGKNRGVRSKTQRKSDGTKIGCGEKRESVDPEFPGGSVREPKSGAARNVGSQVLKMGGGPKCGPHRPGWRRCTVVGEGGGGPSQGCGTWDVSKWGKRMRSTLRGVFQIENLKYIRRIGLEKIAGTKKIFRKLRGARMMCTCRGMLEQLGALGVQKPDRGQRSTGCSHKAQKK